MLFDLIVEFLYIFLSFDCLMEVICDELVEIKE